MGSFAWLRADKNISKNKQANICYGDKIKVLIPKEFGGGCIEGEYLDYGLVEDSNGKQYDLYELIAIWNSTEIRNKISEFYHKDIFLKVVGEEGTLDSKINNIIRSYGVRISCYDEDHAKIKFQLNVVSKETETTYAKCNYFSISDPEQGFVIWYWKEFNEVMSLNLGNYKNYMEELKNKKSVFSKEECEEKLEYTLEDLEELKNEIYLQSCPLFS